MRYHLGFLWGLWLSVAVQNLIRNSPQGMPSAERSFIAALAGDRRLKQHPSVQHTILDLQKSVRRKLDSV
jgi:hypothetical protein